MTVDVDIVHKLNEHVSEVNEVQARGPVEKETFADVGNEGFFVNLKLVEVLETGGVGGDVGLHALDKSFCEVVSGLNRREGIT